MRHQIKVDTSEVVSDVTAEIYSAFAELKGQFERSVDESVEAAKSEIRQETSQLAVKLDSLVVKMVEDKVRIFIGSEEVMEAAVEAVKARLAPDIGMSKKPWWKWW